MNHDHHMGMNSASTLAPPTTTTMHDHGHMKMDDMTTMHDHSNMGGHDMMGMMMYFHVGFEETVLFKQWKTSSEADMIMSCIGIFLIALLYEGLKYFRERLHRNQYIAVDYSKVRAPEGSISNTGEQANQVRTTVSCQTSITSPSHYLQTLLHLVQLILSYFLMLIVMTYNIWLCLAVILGCTSGYYLFGWQKSFLVDITEHCH